MEANKPDVKFGNNDLVNPLGHYDYNDYLNLEAKGQVLDGFDPAYKDFVDYILKITHQIWEEKGIGIIYDTYHNNVVMHFGVKNAIGIDKVIAGTLETLHAFPDRKLIAQNVIWSPHGGDGYLSSHRIISTATNMNDSVFGPATQRKISFRTVVDCAVAHNRIYEEWLVRDNLWIVKQLGFDPVKIAYKMAMQTIDNCGVKETQYGLDSNMEGQFFPEKSSVENQELGEWIKSVFGRIYSYRLFNEVKKYYVDNAVLHYICDRDLTGHEQIQGMLVTLFASFPNARFIIERITYNEIGTNHYDVAVRWRISGIHEGYGMFGPPTGNAVQILGINHLKVENIRITEEWMTYDGLDVLRQILIGQTLPE